MKIIFAFILCTSFLIAKPNDCIGKELWPDLLKKVNSSGFGSCNKTVTEGGKFEKYQCEKVHYSLQCNFYGEEMLYVSMSDNDIFTPPHFITKPFVEEMNKYLTTVVPAHFGVKCEKNEIQTVPNLIYFTCRGSGKIYSMVSGESSKFYDYTFAFKEQK